MRLGSLFSGYGGLDLAVREVFPDAKTVWVSDIDKGACKVLTHRYPNIPNIGDITTVDWPTVAPVDILAGGFPCQDLSHAGLRAGLRPGTRSGLWNHFAYAIDQLKPEWVVIENVPGVLSAKSDTSKQVTSVGPRGGRKVGYTDRALGRVLGDLDALGFDAEWGCLRASDVGACHRRDRWFLVAHARSQ